MLIPYKVKNPPSTFPVATVSIIAANVLVFALTSISFLVVRRDAVDSYALVWGVSPVYTAFTSMFLHMDIFHLAGNMLFLWVFGPAVEDRMKIPAYLGLYVLSGCAGIVAEMGLGAAGAVSASVPMLGASACIMGVLGAYWYMYAWSPVCMFYWIGILWRGTFQVAAVWVIGAYFALDLFNGVLAKSMGATGGTANFAHVGGAFVGAVLVWSLGYKRDSEDVSRVKASHADVKDIEMLSTEELGRLAQDQPDDESLLEKYARKAMLDSNQAEVARAIAMNRRSVLMRCPEMVLSYAFNSPASSTVLTASDVLVLGRWCEANSRPDQALLLYDRIVSGKGDPPELEHALYRSALIHWHVRKDPVMALRMIGMQLVKFPTGSLMFDAEDLRDSIQGQTGHRSEAA